MSQLSTRPRRDASPSLVLVIVCAGVVLASLDLFIVNVALPQMARDFHATGLGDLSWVLNAYAIVYASLLVLFGRLADRYPRERGFLLGIAVFVAASAACGAATSVGMLVAFRVVQAAGAALLTPTSLGLILATYAPERRHSAVRAWTAVGGVAAALGPVVGGLLVAASWRWVFLVNVPIGLAALVVGWLRLPHVPGHPVRIPDPLAALLITGGVGALTLGLVNGGSWGWASIRTLAVLGLAVLALALFAVHCARASNPLIERALFAVRPFTGASVVALLFSAAFGAMLLSRVLWAQDVWHWSALLTGLSIAPGPIMVPLFSFLIAGRLIARFGPGPVIAAGSTIFAAGAAWWALAAGLHADYIGQMLGGHPADGSRRRPDAPDADGHRRRLAAAAGVCQWLGSREHVAPGRPRGGRRGADCRPRLARLAGSDAGRLSARMDRDRRDRVCGRRGRTRAAGAGPSRAGAGRSGDARRRRR